MAATTQQIDYKEWCQILLEENQEFKKMVCLVEVKTQNKIRMLEDAIDKAANYLMEEHDDPVSAFMTLNAAKYAVSGKTYSTIRT